MKILEQLGFKFETGDGRFNERIKTDVHILPKDGDPRAIGHPEGEDAWTRFELDINDLAGNFEPTPEGNAKDAKSIKYWVFFTLQFINGGIKGELNEACEYETTDETEGGVSGSLATF